MAAKKTDKRPLCGATVIRCAQCSKAVAKARVRNGQACPAHPDAATVTSTCVRPVKVDGLRCYLHGAKAPQVVAANLRRLQAREATEELARLGYAIETTPVEALEAMLYEAAANVAVLRELVNDLDHDRLYGQMFHQTGSPTGEAKPHVLVVMYDAERDRLAKLSEVCFKLGLDERKVRIAEAEVGRLFDHVTGAIADCGLTAEQTASFKKALAARIRGGQPPT